MGLFGRVGLVATALCCACASANLGENQPDADPSPADAATADAASSIDAGPQPDAGTGPDAGSSDADGCVPDWTQLLGNADFEAGRTVWTEDIVGSTNAIIRQQGGGLPFPADSGTWAALMLGYNGADLTLSQTVTVPATATMLRLRGARCWVTTETAGTGDAMTITVRSTGGTVLETLASLTNADADAVCSWTALSLDAGASYPGQTVQLVFDGQANGANPTSFAFDTLALEAYACP